MERVKLQPHQRQALRRELVQALRLPTDQHFVDDVMVRVESPSSAAPIAWLQRWWWALAIAGAVVLVTVRVGMGHRANTLAHQAVQVPLLEMQVHRHPHASPGQPVTLRSGDTLRSDDGLTFTLLNRSSKARAVRIFLIDAKQDVTWLHPDGTRADSITLAPQQTLPLPAGISFDELPKGQAQLIAVFGARTWSAAALLGQLHEGGANAVQHAPGVTAVQVMPLQVR